MRRSGTGPTSGATVTITGGTYGFHAEGRQLDHGDGVHDHRHGIQRRLSQRREQCRDHREPSGEGRAPRRGPERCWHLRGGLCRLGRVRQRGADNSASGIYLTGATTRILVTGNEATANAFGWQRNANGIDVRAPGNTSSATGPTTTRTPASRSTPAATTPSLPTTSATRTRASRRRSWRTARIPASGDTTGCFTGDHGIDNLKVTGSRIIGNTVYGNATAGINFEGLVAGTPATP